MVLAADLLLQPANLGREELDGAAASGANHVVVAAAVVLVLEAGDTVMKGNLARQAAGSQQLEGTINRRDADVGVLLLYQTVQFVRGKVVPGLKKSAQDGVPLVRQLKAHSLKMAVKDIFGFSHRLTRDDGMVVDALCEHVSKKDNTRVEGRQHASVQIPGCISRTICANISRSMLAYHFGKREIYGCSTGC
jgi:hypothetical protein